MAKKKKKPTKGVSYIAKVLRKYQSKKFPTYKSALSKAHEILPKLKGEDGKGKVTVKNILSGVVHKKPDNKAPKLPEELTEPSPYYDLSLYPSIIQTETQHNTEFISKMLFKDGAEKVYGGTEVSYEECFKPFVDFCNNLSYQIEQETGRKPVSPVKWNVRCLPPIRKGKVGGFYYIVEIITCNEDGDRYDFGFDPNNVVNTPTIKVKQKAKEAEVKKKEIPKIKETHEEKQEPEKEETSILDKQIELSKQREKELSKEKELSESRIKEKEKDIEVMSKRLELIKELKSLGYNADEIKSLLK